MKNQKVVYLCNFLDDITKEERQITTDSPAANNKVLALCCAMQKAGVDVSVLSMGRGRQRGSWLKWASTTRDVEGVPLIYASFWDTPIITHLITAFSLFSLFVKMKRKRTTIVIAYNRLWHYVPMLLVARWLRVSCYLDLEDGFIENPGITGRFLVRFFDWACSKGSILACGALGRQVKSKKTYVCYGVANVVEPQEKKWTEEKLKVLFGGTLGRNMGVGLFIAAVRLLIKNKPEFKNRIHFVVTGKGDMAEEIEAFASGEAAEWVEFCGAVPRGKFDRIRENSHIGLSLNLPSSGLNDTVFPSKVIELSANGLLLITTRMSDVSKLFSSKDAVLLSDESPERLAGALCWAAIHRNEIFSMAKRGRDVVLHHCSPVRVGKDLSSFLIG